MTIRERSKEYSIISNSYPIGMLQNIPAPYIAAISFAKTKSMK